MLRILGEAFPAYDIGACSTDVPSICQNSGGVRAVGNFDLSLSEFGSDTPCRHEGRPSEDGSPQRRLRHGLKDQRQVKARIPSRCDASFFQRLAHSVGLEQK
jgi:hypothetical protein